MPQQMSSQTKRFPFFYVTIVMPSGHFPSKRSRPVGSSLKDLHNTNGWAFEEAEVAQAFIFHDWTLPLFLSRYFVFDIIIYMHTCTL